MSEKRLRFTMESDKLYSCIFDNGEELTCFELVDLLNEQSERIKSLEMELDLIANTKLFSRRKLEEENEQLKNKLNKGL